MKIYTQDCSWRGAIVVTANSETEARAIMAQFSYINYEPSLPVKEHEIEGFVFMNSGDA